jgi:DNA-binding CsgD family transcriptional regulator/DNA-binding transcriptional ArsR family regulator
MRGELGRLLERDDELAQIDAALAAAAGGRGALVVLDGEPGTGKTALLRAAEPLAAPAGLAVMRARASEMEHGFPFGVVRQWLDPYLRGLGTPERDTLFEGSAAHARAVLEGAAGPSGSSFATLDGLHWIIAGLADRAPLLAVVDDVHWADPDSRRFLAFLTPRLADLPIALVVATRTGEGPDDALTGALHASRPLHLGPLPEDAVHALVEAHLGQAGAETFAIACHRATGGNPFLLHALLDELDRTGVEPTPAAAERILGLGPRAVATAVVARLAQLSPDAPGVARVLGILGDGASRAELAAVTGLDAATVARTLDELERAAIVAPSDDARFVHAITGNAIRNDMGRATRTELHQRAARVLAERRAPAERIAAHLLASGAPLDADALATVREAANDACDRGAVDTAVDLLRQALPHAHDEGFRVGLLVELAQLEALTDGPACLAHLDEALPLAAEPAARVLIQGALARTLLFAGRPADAVDAARAAAGDVATLGDADLAHRFDALQFGPARMEPSLRAVRLELVDRFRRDGLRSDGPGARGFQAGISMHLSRSLEVDAATAVELAGWALAEGILIEHDNGGADYIGAVLALAAADSDRGREVLQAGLVAARRRGDVFAQAACSIFLCQDHLQRGELQEAISAGEHGLAASEACGIGIGVPWGSGYLALAQAEAGAVADAQATLDRAAPSGAVPDSGIWHTFVHARAEVRYLAGDPAAALDAALECGARFAGVEGTNPAVMPWRSLAARCLLQLGTDPDAARAFAGEEVELARRWTAPRALGRALRVEGLALGGEAGRQRLEESEAVLRGSSARLEHAEVLLALGASMRRSNQRAAARGPLTEALALARACGAAPVAVRAAEELAAAGGRPGRATSSGLDALTPSERRVARLAAAGRTNRAIAQELFVSQKTVEFHLGQVFRKLGIGARSELADHLPGT